MNGGSERRWYELKGQCQVSVGWSDLFHNNAMSQVEDSRIRAFRLACGRIYFISLFIIHVLTCIEGLYQLDETSVIEHFMSGSV